MKPEYAKAAELLRDDDPPIGLAKVDCTEAGKETCTKYGVSGYPTLKIFRKGELSSEYNGPREAGELNLKLFNWRWMFWVLTVWSSTAGIVKYMRAQVGPPSKDLKTVEAFDAFLKVQEGAVVGLFAEKSPLEEVFVKYAEQQREKLRFGHSSDKDVLKKAKQT